MTQFNIASLTKVLSNLLPTFGIADPNPRNQATKQARSFSQYSPQPKTIRYAQFS